jgi:hypothetical protein
MTLIVLTVPSSSVPVSYLIALLLRGIRTRSLTESI